MDEKTRLRFLDRRQGPEMGPSKHLHEIALEQGFITKAHIDAAKGSLAQFPGKTIAQILTENRELSEENYFKSYALKFELPYLDLKEIKLDLTFIKSFSEHILKKYRIIPLGREGQYLVIITYDHERPPLYSALKSNGFMFVKTAIARASQIEDFLENRVFRDGVDLQDMSMESLLDQAQIEFKAYNEITGEIIDRTAASGEFINKEQAAVINLVNKTLLDSVAKRASDIHIQPEEEEVAIRYRIDGRLRPEVVLDHNIYRAMMIRLKIISNLDITEKAIPQDGAFKLVVNEKSINFRVAIIPTLYGEGVVIRVLSSNKISPDLSHLGILPEHIPLMKEKIKSSHGMILVSGSTGSGKSTTLHSFLTILNEPEKKIITIEDPVENRLKGVMQIPVTVNRADEKKSLTFAKALRSILRLDPDIIMVGEIRDRETAEISLTAALTGHLVLSSVHANTSIRVISRLLELGVDRSGLVAVLRVIISQKLVRLTCKSCRKKAELNPRHMRMLDLPEDYVSMCEIYNGTGCSRCGGTGYMDRIGLFEILNFDGNLSQMVGDSAGIEDLEGYLSKSGFLTILDQCRIKVIEGLVSMDEYLSVKVYS